MKRKHSDIIKIDLTKISSLWRPKIVNFSSLMEKKSKISRMRKISGSQLYLLLTTFMNRVKNRPSKASCNKYTIRRKIFVFLGGSKNIYNYAKNEHKKSIFLKKYNLYMLMTCQQILSRSNTQKRATINL